MKNKIIVLLSAILFCMTLGLKDAMAAAATDVACKNPCINSFEIQDGQVTSTDIADGAVTNTRISEGAVTGTKIGDGAVSNTKIQDGAVTDAKITGPISSSKIQKPAKIAIVAQSGGDYADPVIAMNNLSAWCGTPAAANPCLLKIMPGVYNVGENSVQMQSYVDIEGSGENATKIVGNPSSYNTGIVNGASNAEIRLLTVEHTGGGFYAIAVYNENASPKMSNVTATASGGTSNYGVSNYSSSPVMTNVTATASGGMNSISIQNLNSSSPIMINITATASGGTSNYGIANDSSSSPTMNKVTSTASGGTNSYGISNCSSSSTMTNVTATALGGINNIGIFNHCGSTIKIEHSVISGSSYTIYNEVATIMIGNTRLDGGPIVNSGGTIICAGVYDENFTFYSNTCP